jgi:hypothetical protein
MPPKMSKKWMHCKPEALGISPSLSPGSGSDGAHGQVFSDALEVGECLHLHLHLQCQREREREEERSERRSNDHSASGSTRVSITFWDLDVGINNLSRATPSIMTKTYLLLPPQTHLASPLRLPYCLHLGLFCLRLPPHR